MKMRIHQAFKDMVKSLRGDLAVKYGLVDIDNMPNDKIIEGLKIQFHTEHEANDNYNASEWLINHELLSDTGERHNVGRILDEVSSIDDQFIWTSYGLFRWVGLIDLINNKVVGDSEEEELFPAGKVVRVCSADKLRNMNFITSWNGMGLREYVGKHFRILGYNKDGFSIPDDKLENLIAPYNGTQRHKKVYVEDAYGNIYVFPQSIFVRTSIKDLVAHEREQNLQRIIEDLEDSAKYRIEELTVDYQDKLREFMESSKKLEECLSGDRRAEAERILEIQMNTKAILEKNVQIATVEYIIGQRLIVETVPLWNSGQPIGRYRINLDLNQWNLRIMNLDISSSGEYQHPHINRNGECCLGEWMNPMRESYSKNDYITLIASIISYLESLHDRSVYVSMGDFQEKRFKKFKYQTTTKKGPKQQKLNIATEENVIADDAPRGQSADLVIIDDPIPEPDMVLSYAENKYQVGDIVKIVNDDQFGFPIGSLCRVAEVIRHNDGTYNYQLYQPGEGARFQHSEQFLVPVTLQDGETQT